MTISHCVGQIGLKTQQSSCLDSLNALITGVHPHTQNDSLVIFKLDNDFDSFGCFSLF